MAISYPISSFHLSATGFALTFWRHEDVSSILDSGQHLNSYHMATFLKVNMETTYFTHFFANANHRHTNSFFAVLMKMCVLVFFADEHVT